MEEEEKGKQEKEKGKMMKKMRRRRRRGRRRIRSIVNLTTITIERYLKVVHPFWSKKHLKRWMIYVAMVFAWIAGILSVAPVVFVSTIVQDGICLSFFVWESQLIKQIINYTVSFAYTLIPVILFVYCYSRIVVVMRRQMRVMAAHNVEGSAQMSASQLQSKRIKWNITKTMIIVSVAFVICWFPTFIYFLVVDNELQTSSDLFVGYYATVFLSYPHIYKFTCKYVYTLLRIMPKCFLFTCKSAPGHVYTC